jgi:hypothetical protein
MMVFPGRIESEKIALDMDQNYSIPVSRWIDFIQLTAVNNR